jgi:hypothetical protein
MTKIIFFGILEFEHWNLFVIWAYFILCLTDTSSQ